MLSAEPTVNLAGGFLSPLTVILMSSFQAPQSQRLRFVAAVAVVAVAVAGRSWSFLPLCSGSCSLRCLAICSPLFLLINCSIDLFLTQFAFSPLRTLGRQSLDRQSQAVCISEGFRHSTAIGVSLLVL